MLAERLRRRRWYQENPELARKARLVRKYGISISEYDELLEKQVGKCGICGELPTDERYGVLNVDHDHLTGKIRGLLCGPCNRGLGQFKDDAGLLRKAISWIT